MLRDRLERRPNSAKRWGGGIYDRKNKVLGYCSGRKDARKTRKLCFLSKILKGDCRKRRAQLQAYVANSCWLNCLYKADVLDFVHNFLPLPIPNRIWLISKHKIQQEEKEPPNTSPFTALVIASNSGLAKWQQVSRMTCPWWDISLAEPGPEDL